MDCFPHLKQQAKYFFMVAFSAQTIYYNLNIPLCSRSNTVQKVLPFIGSFLEISSEKKFEEKTSYRKMMHIRE